MNGGAGASLVGVIPAVADASWFKHRFWGRRVRNYRAVLFFFSVPGSEQFVRVVMRRAFANNFVQLEKVRL